MQTVIIESARDLGKAISAIARTGQKMDAEIHTAAVSCLFHAQQHGDVTLATRLVKSLPKSSRRRALVHWFVTFAPLVYAQGKENEEPAFRLNKGKKAKAFDLERADIVPFWELTTERNPAPFSVDQLVRYVASKLTKAKEKGEIDEAGIQTTLSKLGTLDIAQVLAK